MAVIRMVVAMPWRSSVQLSRRCIAASTMRADRAHGAALGRGGEAQQDRAEHQEDQHQRRHHAPEALSRRAPSRCSVRASGGKAGTASGRKMLRMKI